MRITVVIALLLIASLTVAAQSQRLWTAPLPPPQSFINDFTYDGSNKVFTFDASGTGGGSLTDVSSWGMSTLRITRNLDAASGQFYLVNAQAYATNNSGSTVNYEKAAIIAYAKTNDPSGTTLRDMVGVDARGIIASTNPSGRAWGINVQGIIEPGGDGLPVGGEFGLVNGGSDQPAVNTTTSKDVVRVIAGGNGATTGIHILANSDSGLHRGIYMAPAHILGTNSADGFIELLNTWRVKKDGFTGIGNADPKYQLSVSGTSNAPSLSSFAGVASFRTSSTAELTFGGYTSTPFSFWMQTKDSTNSSTAYPLLLNPLGGNIGIGVTTANAKLHVAGGDVAVTTQGNGVILRATNGANCFLLTVDNAGALSTASVTCP